MQLLNLVEQVSVFMFYPMDRVAKLHPQHQAPYSPPPAIGFHTWQQQ
jgi:hypothetical protein